MKNLSNAQSVTGGSMTMGTIRNMSEPAMALKVNPKLKKELLTPRKEQSSLNKEPP